MTWSKAQIGYCSNVHPGETAELVELNIASFTQAIRQGRSLEAMQHGLWLSEHVCDEYISEPHKLKSLKQRLSEFKLSIVTLNAFPVGHFHDKKVKYAVYRPHWAEFDRFNFTCKSAEILSELLPDNESFGTLSTLPLGYAKEWIDEHHNNAIHALCKIVSFLSELENRTGKHIQLCIEMEPGCILEETAQLITLFQQHLPPVSQQYHLSQAQIHRYLGVCFDICHQAVMYENIYDSLQKIVDLGINIGKIQVSSALKIKNPSHPEVKTWLAEYAESRYLHQVTAITAEGKRLFSDDLELTLSDQRFQHLEEWRIHFHVPIHETTLGNSWLATTSSDIRTVFSFLSKNPQCHPQIELETYSWNVLPLQHRPKNNADLINGIQAELHFIECTLAEFSLLKTR